MTDDIIVQVCDGLDMLNEDTSIPRNIRRGADEIKTMLLSESDPLDVRVATATSRPGFAFGWQTPRAPEASVSQRSRRLRSCLVSQRPHLAQTQLDVAQQRAAPVGFCGA